MFQSVITPNGLICHLFGPLKGRRHDAFMLHESGLLQELARKMNKANGDPYVIYGDPAYPVRRHILAPFRGAQLTPAEQNFNAAMSAVRTSVEWGNGKIIKYFAFLDFSKNMKVLLQPVGKLYIVAALLVNCHTCLYGSQTTQVFAVDAPELETYLNNCSLNLVTFNSKICFFIVTDCKCSHFIESCTSGGLREKNNFLHCQYIAKLLKCMKKL